MSSSQRRVQRHPDRRVLSSPSSNPKEMKETFPSRASPRVKPKFTRRSSHFSKTRKVGDSPPHHEMSHLPLARFSPTELLAKQLYDEAVALIAQVPEKPATKHALEVDMPETLSIRKPLKLRDTTSTWAGAPARSWSNIATQRSNGYCGFSAEIAARYPTQFEEMDNKALESLWSSQSKEIRQSFDEEAQTMQRMTSSYMKGLVMLTKLQGVSMKLKQETAKLQKRLHSIPSLELPILATTSELEALKNALGERFPAYVRELHHIFKAIRFSFSQAKVSKEDLYATFATCIGGRMAVVKFFEELDKLASISLSKREASIFANYLDRSGTQEIDLQAFFQCYQSVLPPRQELIDRAFASFPMHLNNNEASRKIRIYRINAKVKAAAARASENELSELLEQHDVWLKQLQENTQQSVSQEEWVDFYCRLSDIMDEDRVFVLLFNELYDTQLVLSRENATDLADYNLMEKHNLRLQLKHSYDRNAHLQHELEDVMDKLKDSQHHLSVACRDLRALAYIQTSFALANNEQVEHVIFHTLSNLIVLSLENAALSSLPQSICNLQHLRTLQVAHNAISKLPSDIGQLQQLTTLHLRNNSLHAAGFPESFGALRLQHLNIEYNQLELLPKTFAGLSSLKTLVANHNKMQAIAPSFCNEFMILEKLILHDNYIRHLPSSLNKLGHLQHFELHQNSLASLPMNLSHMTNLQHLTLHNNKLKIPLENAEWPDLSQLQLQSMTLSHNQLKTLPVSFGSMAALTAVHLPLNELRDVMAIPFDLLVSCTEIDLHANLLQAIPPSIFQMPKLRICQLHQNRLAVLPSTGNTSIPLEELMLQKNRIKEVPSIFGRFKFLRVFNLCNNMIKVLPDSFIEFGNRSSIAPELRLEGNPLAAALGSVVAQGYFESPTTKLYNMALRKLVDDLASRAKGFVDSDQGAKIMENLDIRSRKGFARNVAMFLDVRLHSLSQNGDQKVSTEVFFDHIATLEFGWSKGERQAVEKTHSSHGCIDIGTFLDAVESLSSTRRGFNVARAVSCYLNETKEGDATDKKMESARRKSYQQLRHHKHTKIKQEEKKPERTKKNMVVAMDKREMPSETNTSRLALKLRREQERVKILEQQLLDAQQVHSSGPEFVHQNLANIEDETRCRFLIDPVGTGMGNFSASVNAKGSVLDLKHSILDQHAIPIETQILVVRHPSSLSRRLADNEAIATLVEQKCRTIILIFDSLFSRK